MAGESYIEIRPGDRWILDADNNIVGVQNSRANGNDLRTDTLATLSQLSSPTGASLVGSDSFSIPAHQENYMKQEGVR